MVYETALDLAQILTQLTRDPRDFAGQEDTLRQKLSGLSAKQRLLIENAFYSHNWTAGSAAVIRLLCEKDLFCLPIYLFNLKDPEEQKNIFNDLLETEHFLLSKVVASSMLVSGIGHKLKEILAEGIANLLSDLVNDPDLIVPNYLQHLQLNYLNAREMEYLFHLHLTSFLELDSCLSTRDAIAQQSRWEEENPLQRNQCLMLITAETCSKYEKVLGMLIDRMLVPSFVHWKFGLALLKVVLRSAPEMRSVLKKHLSTIFVLWISKRSEFHFHLLMLLGRQLAYSAGSSAEKCSTYQMWYKFQLADMTYTLKSKDDFQFGVKQLTALVPVECDADFVRIHINTAIPAPPYCKVYVTAFKEASKRKEGELLADPVGELEADEDDLFIIID